MNLNCSSHKHLFKLTVVQIGEINHLSISQLSCGGQYWYIHPFGLYPQILSNPVETCCEHGLTFKDREKQIIGKWLYEKAREIVTCIYLCHYF